MQMRVFLTPWKEIGNELFTDFLIDTPLFPTIISQQADERGNGGVTNIDMLLMLIVNQMTGHCSCLFLF